MNERETHGILTRGMLIAAGTNEVFIKGKKRELGFLDDLKQGWDFLHPDVREYWCRLGHWVSEAVKTEQWGKTLTMATLPDDKCDTLRAIYGEPDGNDIEYPCPFEDKLCPVCKQELKPCPGGWACTNGHGF